VDEHDINGFRVYVNNNPIFHCTTMTVHSPDDHHKAKANTCHTSGATYLSERDKVSLRDVNGLRYSLFEPSKSFFGLIKLTDAKLK
jgi:TNF(Tumour Necrosis Factor) family.